MEQPAYWVALTAAALVAMGVRLVARRPLWRQRSTRIRPRELALGAVVVTALVFHCAAMFFADWIDAVPFADGPASAVRTLGLSSQVTYWVPAVALVVCLRRVWAPALAVLTAVLLGVGYTMFVPHSLNTHLMWLAAAAITLVVIAAALVAPLRGEPPMSV
jgi:hypothetical protein